MVGGLCEFGSAGVLDWRRGLSNSTYGRVLLFESWNGYCRLGVTGEFYIMCTSRRDNTWNEDSNEFVEERQLGLGFWRFFVPSRRGGGGV